MTTNRYLILDSRFNPVAHGTSENRPGDKVWEIEIDHGNMKEILSHEYVRLASTSERIPAVEGKVVDFKNGILYVEPTKKLGEEVRRNLRMPTNFRSYIYPVTGHWKGRREVIGNDISCGGVSFYCDEELKVSEIVEIVIPITSEPIILLARILRQRPSGDGKPMYATMFYDMIYDQEKIVREAVFNLQLDAFWEQEQKKDGEKESEDQTCAN